MIRLRDLAEQLGLSVMTVSRSLRDAPGISAVTRERVRKLARELGYVPNIAARGLRTRNTHLIGLVVPTLSDPILARVVCGVEERARDTGYEIILAQSLNQVEREEACLKGFLARQTDGILVWPLPRLTPEAPVLAEQQRHNARVVLLGSAPTAAADHLLVAVHDFAASVQLTQHLLSLGHRRIAYLRGHPTSPIAQDRFEGYRRALREAGLEVDDRLVFHAGSTFEDGATAALQMVNEGIRPDAIQAFNDPVAVGAAEVLVQQGWRIPEDVSLAGFGNVPVGEHHRVPLTTMRQPKHRLGVAAVDLLLASLRGERVGSLRLPADLLLRASTARREPVAGG